MNNFFKIILLFTIGLTIVSCSKSDSNTEPLRDYTDQYNKDLASIETYMQTHYMTVTNNSGATDDMDVEFHLIDAGQTSIWAQTDYPIQTRLITVKQNDVDINYKIYYLKLREGSGSESKSPCNVDRVLTSYRGEYIFSSTEQVDGVDVTTIKSTQFEELINPQSYFNLTSVIRGWSEIFPQFKTGSYIGNPDGTVSYQNFGAGVMFIPSGLAYYSGGSGGIPTYSPLIFSFKLYEIERVDHDSDGIDSYLEDLNGDGYVYAFAEGISNPDNTNAPGTSVLIGPNKYSLEDEVPNFLDIDDDGDYYTTESEIRDVNGDPLPFINIPTCGGTSTKKKHLDPLCR
ncbi:MAG: FKBP-type peptidylprolyl isomerase [Flavobacterium sp. JAD_PAG50586_2]|nr:MAG: FKBP-type peptidylprolyl isomerase [Flavobacterium sp. JAD_PAG50586_2]